MSTPFLRYHLQALAQVCRSVLEFHQRNNLAWQPELSGSMPADVLAIIQQSTLRASCRSIDDARALVAAGFEVLLISRPLADPASCAEVAKLAAVSRAIVVIDHFRHAELLSAAAIAAESTIEVLIGVECGSGSAGVRPGPDATRLALAASKLAGVVVGGVYVNDVADKTGYGEKSSHGNRTGHNSETDSTAKQGSQDEPAPSSLTFSDALVIAQHCQRMITTVGVCCSEIASGRRHLESVKQDLSISLCTPFCSAAASVHDQNIGVAEKIDALRQNMFLATLVARVLSRPTLETCIIDVGRQHLLGESLKILHPSGASLSQLSDDVSLIRLTRESLDLRIGDEVTIAIEPPFPCLRSLHTFKE